MKYIVSKSLVLLTVLALGFSSCGKKSDAPSTSDSMKAVNGIIPPPQPAPGQPVAPIAAPNPHGGSFSATYDGKKLEASPENSWAGSLADGMPGQTKPTKAVTVGFLLLDGGDNVIISIDFMDGKVGETTNTNIIYNSMRGGYQATPGKQHAKVTKVEAVDAAHILYSAEFEFEISKMDPNDNAKHIVKGTMENIFVKK